MAIVNDPNDSGASQPERDATVGPPARTTPESSPAGWRARLLAAARRLLRDPVTIAALVFLIALVLAAVLAPWVAPYNPIDQVASKLLSPSFEHLLGTDNLGRDTLSRLIHGAQASLAVAAYVLLLTLGGAVPLGILAGYFGRWVDSLMMRLADLGMAFPPIVLAIAVAAILGPGPLNTAIALTIVMLPGMIRIVRGQALAISSETFVEASKAIGTPTRTIMLKRVLPSTASPVIVQSTVILSNALIAEASLSFLGLGTQLPHPSWGGMLRDAYNNALFSAQFQVIVPAIALVLTVLAMNKIGDALRDAFGLSRNVPRGRTQRRGLTSVSRPSSRGSTP